MAREDTQFKKGNKLGGNGGRPKEHPLKGKISLELIDAMVKLLKMKKSDAVKKMGVTGNPTLIEITAWKYITDYPTEVIDRFCGRIPQKQEFGGEVNGTVSVTLNLAAD